MVGSRKDHFAPSSQIRINGITVFDFCSESSLTAHPSMQSGSSQESKSGPVATLTFCSFQLFCCDHDWKTFETLHFCRLNQIFDQHSWANDLPNVISCGWDSLNQGIDTRSGHAQTGDKSGCQGSCSILLPVWVCNWEQMCHMLSFLAASADSSFLVPILSTKLEFVLPRSTHGC